MADCKIVNASVVNAVSAIGGANQGQLEGIALQYKEAGETLMDALKNAIAEMEGETKDALKIFFHSFKHSLSPYNKKINPCTKKNGTEALIYAVPL